MIIVVNKNLAYASIVLKMDPLITSKNPTIFNTIRWVAGLIVSLTKHLMVQVFF